MINNSVLTGRLTKDVDLRYTTSGKPVGNFTLAVNRPKNKDGEQQVDFINCVVWNKQAESMSQYTKKGSLVGVVGSIQTRNYENNQGQRVYVTEVLVRNVTFLESSNSQNSARSYTDNAQGDFNSKSNNYSSSNQNGSQGTYNQSDDVIDISDDELPF